MKVAIIILIIIIVIMFIEYVLYRRQIKKICRQLAFINENDTNMQLPETGAYREINALNEQINKVIMHKKNMERETKQKENLLKEMITNISHDIRTPLTSLDGYFQLLAYSDSKAEREKYMSVIAERMSSLRDMLEELFTFAKLQNDRYELEVESVDMSKIVYDTAFSFFDLLKQKSVKTDIDFSEKQYWVRGNKEAIRRILQNVIKNAMEHGENSILLRYYEYENDIIFECVNDVKYPEEIDITQIFNRFYKADSARTQASTGLGLAIAKGLTEQIGAEIEAELKNEMFIIRIKFVKV